jgi:hypothetical protein
VTSTWDSNFDSFGFSFAIRAVIQKVSQLDREHEADHCESRLGVWDVSQKHHANACHSEPDDETDPCGPVAKITHMDVA